MDLTLAWLWVGSLQINFLFAKISFGMKVKGQRNPS